MISLSYKNSSDFYRSKITPVNITPPEWRLRGQGTFFAGSCFADYLYSEFESAELRAAASPFGNIYNPASLSASVNMMGSAGPGGHFTVRPEDCFKTETGYRHFMFHSLKQAQSAEALADMLNSKLAEARCFLEEAESAVITLGTAFVFKLKNGEGSTAGTSGAGASDSTGRIVNNCHKLPAKNFSRSMLSVEEAAAAVESCIAQLRKINPGLKIILTLSPVRHLRDDAAENSLSKAVLRCAIDRACSGSEDFVWYFPSYEIMLDELRDYRWYAEDLCHPSAEAVSYIISRFIGSIYNEEFTDLLDSWMKIQRDLNHKPFNPDSEEYRLFIQKAEKKKEALLSEQPVVFQRFKES